MYNRKAKSWQSERKIVREWHLISLTEKKIANAENRVTEYNAHMGYKKGEARKVILEAMDSGVGWQVSQESSLVETRAVCR